MKPSPHYLLGGELVEPCGKIAKRCAAYRDQGVIFKGVGFTKTVLPPPPPKAGTEAGEPVADWEDHMHEYAGKQYEDDKEHHEERKKQAGGMIEEVKSGHGFKRT